MRNCTLYFSAIPQLPTETTLLVGSKQTKLWEAVLLTTQGGQADRLALESMEHPS